MHKILSMASITFMQGLRAQTFRIVGLIFLCMLAITYVLRVLSVGHTDIMLRSFGLSAMEISGLLLIIFGCISAFYREKENRLQAIHLTYVSFFHHVCGRYLGNILLLGSYVIFVSIACSLILFHEQAWHISFLIGSYSVFLKLAIVCAFCSLFSSLFKSSIFASVITFLTYIASDFASYPLAISRENTQSIHRIISSIVYHILPSFDKIDLKHIASQGEIPQFSHMTEISIYSLVYVAMIILLSWKVFSNHEH